MFTINLYLIMLFFNLFYIDALYEKKKLEKLTKIRVSLHKVFYYLILLSGCLERE